MSRDPSNPKDHKSYFIVNNVKYDDMLTAIQDNKNHINLDVTMELVLSWRLIVFRNADTDLINRFTPETKRLNLNFDHKREWKHGWTWANKLTPSLPFIEIDL